MSSVSQSAGWTASQHQDRMEVTVLLLILLRTSCTCTCTGNAKASLTVIPNRSQFFRYESVSLSCDEEGKSTGWKVKGKTAGGVVECGDDWGFLNASSCTIKEAYQWNSGVYWCESRSGERSMAANITVIEGAVILESPVLPVMEGDAVTLRCTTKSNSSTLRASIFIKDRSPIGAAVTGETTIPAVSKSDEGLYMCLISDLGQSPESWLAVRDPSPLLSVSRLMCHLMVATPYLLSTIILGLIYRDRARAQCPGDKRSCDDVLTENPVLNSFGPSGEAGPE